MWELCRLRPWGMPAPLAVNSKPAWAKEEGNQLGSHLRGDAVLLHAVQVLPSLRASRHPEPQPIPRYCGPRCRPTAALTPQPRPGAALQADGFNHFHRRSVANSSPSGQMAVAVASKFWRKWLHNSPWPSAPTRKTFSDTSI